MDGILVVDKPSGITSHDVVNAVRKLLNTKKVGHTGTLDPAATGVLPLLIGKATKLSQYLMGSHKTYLATVTFGIVTDTYDADGEIREENPVDVSQEQLECVLANYRGKISQIPPMYSAKKISGRKLYELAREGKEIEREPKTVNISQLDLLEYGKSTAVLEVTCSAGTYIRSLAYDIGRELGCGAHLSKLCRTKSGDFGLETAVTLDAMEEGEVDAHSVLISLADALKRFPVIRLPPQFVRRVANGYQLTVGDLSNCEVPAFEKDETVVLTKGHGEVLAVTKCLTSSENLKATFQGQQALRLERVFSECT